MAQTITNIVNYVADNFLFIFGIYSILFFILYHYRSDKKTLKAFDKTAINVVIWTGTIWILLKISALIMIIFQARMDDNSGTFSQNLYWLLDRVWFQLLFWLVLPHLLRIKFISRYLLPRMIIAFFYAFSFERISRLLIDFHRDYLPSTFNMNMEIWELIPALLLKTLIFTIIIGIFYYIKRFLYGEEEAI